MHVPSWVWATLGAVGGVIGTLLLSVLGNLITPVPSAL